MKIMLQNGETFRAKRIAGWYDCGKKETLLSTSSVLLDGQNHILGKTENSVLIPPVYIGPGAEVKSSVLGPNVTVSAGCRVERSIAEDCIFYENSSISDINLKESIIGENSVLRGSRQVLDLGDHSRQE